MPMRDAGASPTWSRTRLTAVAALVWTILLGVSLAWNWYQIEDAALLRAGTEARAAFVGDVVYRRWASQVGGVYVAVSEATPPNPYLAEVPDRDVVTTTGKHLTLVNPAYMTRQVHELGLLQYGARGHITSLKPLRPENKADAWETEALGSFERGVKEVVSLEAMGGRPFLRLMRPLMIEASCLTCHGFQGYKVGDIRGGISVSQPYEPYEQEARSHEVRLAWAHLLVGSVGFIGLFFWHVQLRRSDRALTESGLRHRMVLQTAMDGFWVFDRRGRLVEVNDAYCRMSGYSEGELLAMRIPDLEAAESAAETEAHIETVLATGEDRFDTRHRRKDGSMFSVEVSAQAKHTDVPGEMYLVAFIRDVSALEGAHAEREHLRAQLGQAQRLESIGRLAGGIAHDFNNMLGVIRGYTELALNRLDPSDPLHGDLTEVQKAAGRSADLTGQLLAFARQQVAAPKVLDLNDTVEGMLKMLRRLIGENIELQWIPGTGLWPVRMDPAQIDQILANLCVNARDAIAGVGRVTLDTGNDTLTEAFCAARPGFVPGDYVRLEVRDTCPGMTQDVIDHIFEPFFTTKPVGEGTGLGLATVYGIVKQNQAFIDVVSEPGFGAAFAVYIPRHAADITAAGAPAPAPKPDPLGGAETILIVEDETALLKMTAIALRRLGYHVLTAATPAEAMRLGREYAESISLLVTDVVMPQMNGRELYERLTALRPGLRCLFMSGYTASIIGPQGILEPGTHFIQKPFSMHDLAQTVRRVLDEA